MPLPTPFHPRTSELCTSLRWKEWAGYHAVCRYDPCHDREYFALRHGTGLIDVTPLFKYELRGPGACDLLSRVTVRDAARLKPMQVAYTCWCDDEGKVLDDGTIANLGEGHYRMTAAEPTFAWLDRHARGLEVEIEDVTDRMACLAVQGPTSRETLRRACDADVDDLGFFRATPARFGAVETTLTRTGYTGDLGYEVWLDADRALELYDRVLEASRDLGGRPVGLDALDMSRIEAGFMLAGVDYHSARHCPVESRKSTPYQLGLDWMVHLDRAPFVGQAALRAEREAGPTHLFVGLEIDMARLEDMFDAIGLPVDVEAEACRESVPLYSGARQVGYVTSRTFSPTLKRYLALATVEAPFGAVGLELEVEATVEHERRTVPARVVERPFFDPERKRARGAAKAT